MSSGGENEEQQAGKNADSDRNNVQNLLSMKTRRGIKAAQHVLVPQSHGSKHKHCQNGMNPVNKPQLELAQIRERRAVRIGRVVEEPEAFEGGKAIVNPAVGGLDAVGE